MEGLAQERKRREYARRKQEAELQLYLTDRIDDSLNKKWVSYKYRGKWAR